MAEFLVIASKYCIPTLHWITHSRKEKENKLQATLEDANPKLSLTHLLTDGGEV